MGSCDLFGKPIESRSSSPVKKTGGTEPPRVKTPNRQQVQLRPFDLDALLTPDHLARAIWSLVEGLDLGAFYEEIESRGSRAGRSATDPKLLVALWLYATTQGVGRAREVDRLCKAHDAYRWLCGDVEVNYHTLSDFRVGHEAKLDDLMAQVLAALAGQGLVKLRRVAQDGMRIRASAGAASFRREKRLRLLYEAAQQQVATIKQEAERPEPGTASREQAAAERAAREREERVARALAELPKIRAVKPTEKEKAEARVSTTDADARVMKMADGGFRPAYNVQLASDAETRVIVGVDVSNNGSDMGQMDPMVEQLEQRHGKTPDEYLVDGGFAKKESIEAATEKGMTVYAPVPTPRVPGIDPHEPKKGDSEAVADWRQRMATAEAKEIYKDRAATAETVNADLRTWRGLDRLGVRGIHKTRCVVLWAVLGYNVLKLIAAAGGA
jgi:transposase